MTATQRCTTSTCSTGWYRKPAPFWTAVSPYVLVAIVKERLRIQAKRHPALLGILQGHGHEILGWLSPGRSESLAMPGHSTKLASLDEVTPWLAERIARDHPDYLLKPQV